MVEEPSTAAFCSPFATVLGPHSSSLPAVFREQYLLASPDHDVVLEGEMVRVWHRPFWLRPLLALMARCDLFFPETGGDVPFRVTIRTEVDRHGKVWQSWQRDFAFATPRRFAARVGCDLSTGQVVEYFGPRSGLAAGWEIRMREDSVLQITTRGAALCVGRGRLRLPRLLMLDTLVIERALPGEGEDAGEIALLASSPILGSVFGYEGRFRLRRVPREP